MITTMLIENLKCPADDELVSENGLSMHISHNGHNVLFDAGNSDKFAKNAKKMGISLKDVDAAVMSHGHKDHTNGLSKFLSINDYAKIYIKKSAFDDLLINYKVFKRKIGTDQRILEEHMDRFVFVDSFMEILPDFYLLTDFKNKYPKNEFNSIYMKKMDGRAVPDDFDHEMCMVLKMEKGLSVYTGCAHANILNMLDSVTKIFPDTRIRTVMGGLHLVGIPIFSEENAKGIHEIGEGLLSFNVKSTHTCHCTSRRGYRALKEVMHEKVSYFFTGSQVEL